MLLTTIVLIMVSQGYYFNDFLQESFLNSNKQRILFGLNRVKHNLQKIENELVESLAFSDTNEAFLASLELVNNYQDKNNYNRYLIDEEKKLLAESLLHQVKHSFNDDIALYDQNEELVAYAIRKEGQYYFGFQSFYRKPEVFFSRAETDAEYQEGLNYQDHLIKNRHVDYYKDGDPIDFPVITRVPYRQALLIKSHHSLRNANDSKVIGHVEMGRVLNDFYFTQLTEETGVELTLSTDGLTQPEGQNIQNITDVENFNIVESKELYAATTWVATGEDKIFISASVQKSEVNQLLQDHRRHLLFFLLATAILGFAITRYFFNYRLSRPLNILMDQIDLIRQKKYQVGSVIHSGDELEKISNAINVLASTIREREKSLEASKEELEYLSYHDPLTDLPNRRFFEDRLKHALLLAERTEAMLGVFFLDLDEFKHVNDTKGHDIGDELLVEASRRLKKHVRNVDTLARIGGDEFMILVENITEDIDIEKFAIKLLKLFQSSFYLDGKQTNITASIGIAVYPKDGLDSISLVKNADIAMYKSKNSGRNSFSFFSESLSEQIRTRTERIHALEDAIHNGDEFELWYQPKMLADQRQIHAVEALIRWNSKDYGYIFPNDFIPLAEETGLIIPIGEWILQQAGRDFIYLKESGLTLDHVSINISSVQMERSNMVKSLRMGLLASGIAPEQVDLELTERYLATDAETVMESLKKFREIGCQVTIDDFGTGFSSLSYLKKLPVSRLKIDKAFIDDLPYSLENAAITKSIISLAKTFGLKVTAEGVEKEQQVAYLEKLQCDELQGFYFSRPVKIEQLLQAYAKSSPVKMANKQRSVGD